MVIEVARCEGSGSAPAEVLADYGVGVCPRCQQRVPLTDTGLVGEHQTSNDTER